MSRQFSDPVYGEGCKPARICLVGQCPGIEEARSGRPFIGPSGQLLRNLLRWVGIDPSLCWITNLCKIWPGKGPDGKDLDPTPEQIAEWAPYLETELQEVQPEIVVGIGRLAAGWLLGRPVVMKVSHGMGEIDTGSGRLVIAVMHPASVLHDPTAGPALVWDIQQLGKIARFGLPAPRPEAHTYVSRCDVFPVTAPPAVESDLHSLIGMDTEGTPETPWCSSLSYEPGYAWVVRAGGRPGDVSFMGKPTVLFHYSIWDIPVVRALGIDLGQSVIRDTCVAAYNLGVEPQGLKELVARHYGRPMQHFTEVVAPWVEKARLAMLEKAWQKLQADAPPPPSKSPKSRKRTSPPPPASA